jgi:multicomponent Na+:H+ antiporter subunit C
MILDQLPYLVAAWLLLVGLYGVVTSRNFVHLAVCVSVMQSSTYVLLLAVGYRKDATAPIFKDVPQGTRAVDPVVQALVLTDIVVAVTVTALLLALAIEAKRHAGTVDPDELPALKG